MGSHPTESEIKKMVYESEKIEKVLIQGGVPRLSIRGTGYLGLLCKEDQERLLASDPAKLQAQADKQEKEMAEMKNTIKELKKKVKDQELALDKVGNPEITPTS